MHKALNPACRALAILAAMAGVPGCASAPKAPPPTPMQPQAAGYGLELRLWPVDESSASLARVLVNFDQKDSPIDDRTAKRLRDSGLRAVIVPTAQLDAIAAELHFAGKVETQAARDRSQWSVLVAGPSWPGYVTLSSADGNLALRAGQVRLIGRAWIAPGKFDRGKAPAVLRVEIAGRHAEERDSFVRLEDALRPTQRRTPPEEGLPLESLNASIELSDGQSLLLIPEFADVDWAEAARLPNYIEREPEKSIDTAAPSGAASSTVVGPAIPKIPSIGHALLTDSLLDLQARKRAILVLVPRVPAEFRLLR